MDFVPSDVTPDDFFRARRVGNGWQVEMIRVKGDHVEWRKDVWAWDMVSSVERRLLSMAFESERRR